MSVVALALGAASVPWAAGERLIAGIPAWALSSLAVTVVWSAWVAWSMARTWPDEPRSDAPASVEGPATSEGDGA